MAESKPIVILHVITTLGRGGAERQLVNLVVNTDRAKFQHIVCCLRGPVDFAPEIERAGHKVINLDLRGKHPWISGARKLAGIMRIERPCFVQTWLYDATIVGRFAQLITRREVTLLNMLQSTDYEADTISAYGLSSVKINLLRVIDKWTARLTNALYLPVSQTVADSYLRHLALPRDRVRILYNSVDLSSLACREGAQEDLRQALGIRADAFIFLNVGRMDLSKGQAHLLRAFAPAAAADSRAHLVIVGDGFLRPELLRLAGELGIAERVCMPGQRGDIGVFLEMADVFVFPSLVEGLGVAPIEAMMMELPCIASNLGALREVFDDGETGILVTPGSENELTAAMLALAADPVRCKALGAAARESAIRRFDNRAGISRWEETYQQLATDSGVSREAPSLPNMFRNQRTLILHVITSLGRGGAERQLVNLVSNTDRTRFQHTVVFLREPDDFAAEIRAAECKCICLGIRGRTRWIYAAKMLRQIIKAERPDIIHTSLYDANISIRLAAPFGSTIPHVVSVQSADYAPETLAAADLPRGKVGLIRVLDSFSARWSDPLFVACSDFVKESVSERLKIPLARVEVIYNSVDPKTLESSASDVDRLKMTLGIPVEGFVFLNVGRLDPAKGQTVLLKSFQEVADRMPNAYLVVLGQGLLKQDLIELANRLGISEKVLLPGARSDVGNFLSLADVFVFPSFFEGLPLALIEAMSKGLPCIVSDIETLREVAKDEETGLLVSPGSVDELANAMLELYANPAKRTFLGDRAQKETNRKFHIGVTIGQWEKLYSRFARNNESES